MNKASRGYGIPVELFQILKDDAVKVVAHNMPANWENSAVATGLEKFSFHSNPKERQRQTMFHRTSAQLHSSHMLANVQNSPSEASTVHESRTSRCSSWI